MSNPQPYLYNFSLSRIIDGDTIVGDIDLGFNLSLHDQHIRLIGINTPEVRGINKLQGLKVKEFVSNLLLDSTILIRSFDKDSFGRVLAIVYYTSNDGLLINLNDLLVNLEMATVY